MRKRVETNWKGEAHMDSTMIRLICAAIAAAFLVLIVVRRRKKAE